MIETGEQGSRGEVRKSKLTLIVGVLTRTSTRQVKEDVTDMLRRCGGTGGLACGTVAFL